MPHISAIHGILLLGPISRRYVEPDPRRVLNSLHGIARGGLYYDRRIPGAGASGGVQEQVLEWADFRDVRRQSGAFPDRRQLELQFAAATRWEGLPGL